MIMAKPHLFRRNINGHDVWYAVYEMWAYRVAFSPSDAYKKLKADLMKLYGIDISPGKI